MKMMQKKIRSLIYAGLGLILCVLLCGGVGMTAQAEESKTYGDFTYEEAKDGITITGYTGEAKKVVIPDKINGTEVISIGNKAFWECTSLTGVTIPEGVTSIGDRAFEDCTSLTSVTIPEGVTSIGNDAFSLCGNLTSISLPKSLTSIGSYGFSGTDLTSITIPENVRSIGCEAFFLCDKLKKVVLPEGITRISSKTFAMCSNLTSITIPDSVTSIGNGVFCGCSKLKSVVIPDSVIEIDVFKKGENQGEYWWLLFDPNTTIICNKNSAAYKYAKENNLPIKLMPKPAKKGTILTVPSKKIKVKVTSSSKKNPTVAVMKITNKKAKKLTIPSTVKVGGVTYKVTAVASQVFKGNKNLTNITIGRGITKIGNEAFSGCKNLKKITVTAGNLTTIRKSAFKGINKKATITVKGTKKAKTALKKQLKKKSVGYVKTWKIK
ncbi:leucine-rich repeat domain-containing protein [Coprococcus sp. HCN-4056]|uniref:leucine-rich repeat domain-containing protein n=1 Tax=Coprococcus sp. HCN-4056 TaxID=3134671 RepID=UPI0030C5A475